MRNYIKKVSFWLVLLMMFSLFIAGDKLYAYQLTQSDYRWYENINAIQPATPKEIKNTSITNVMNNDVLRVRINIRVAD